MMTEVEEEGLSSSGAPEVPAAAARSEEPEQRAPDNGEQTPKTETSALQSDKRPPETLEQAAEPKELAPEPEKWTTPEIQERAPETKERAPETQERAPMPTTPPESGPPLEVPAPVDRSLLQYKLKKFFVLRVKHFHFPFIEQEIYCLLLPIARP